MLCFSLLLFCRDNMDQLYKLEVHYGGTFQYIPQLIYSGGTLDYVDCVIPEFFRWSEEMLKDLLQRVYTRLRHFP